MKNFFLLLFIILFFLFSFSCVENQMIQYFQVEIENDTSGTNRAGFGTSTSNIVGDSGYVAADSSKDYYPVPIGDHYIYSHIDGEWEKLNNAVTHEIKEGESYKLYMYIYELQEYWSFEKQ